MSDHPPHACPRCDHHPSMETGFLRGIAVRICRDCKSILMTRTDLRAVLGIAARSAHASQPAAPTYFQRIKHQPKWVNEDPSIRCPECRYNMYEAKNHGIAIDFCLNCEAVWFDEGELRAALTVARTAGDLDLVPDEPGKNETAALIAYMLDTITTEPRR